MISASSNEEGIMMMSASGATPFRPVLPTSLPAAMFVTSRGVSRLGFREVSAGRDHSGGAGVLVLGGSLE